MLAKEIVETSTLTEDLFVSAEPPVILGFFYFVVEKLAHIFASLQFKVQRG